MIQTINNGETGAQASAKIYANDMELQDGQAFAPLLEGAEYFAKVKSEKWAPSQQENRITAEGAVELYGAPGVSMGNGNIGIKDVTVPSGTAVRLRAVFRFYGFANPAAETTNFMLYYVGATLTNTRAKVTDLGGGRYLYAYDLPAQADTVVVSLFGPQVTDDSPVTTANASGIVCDEASLSLLENAGASNQLTKGVQEYVAALEIAPPLAVTSKNWLVVPFGNAVARPGGNGFTVPAGQGFNDTYTQLSLKIDTPADDTKILAFFRMSENLAGFTFSQFRYDLDNVVHITPLSHTSLGGDLYKIDYTLPGNAQNNGVIELTVQNTGGASTAQPYYFYWEKGLTVQDVDYTAQAPSFQEQAVRKIVSEALQDSQADGLTVIEVSADPSASTLFKGKNAIQQAIDSITDASPVKRYQVYARNGIYKVTNSSEYLGSPGYPAFVNMKDYVDLLGESKEGVILWAELPYEDADIDTAIPRVLHQTMWNKAKDANVKNVSLYAKNIRYALHQDNAATSNSNRNYDNVDMTFIGDKGNHTTYGLGSWSGETNYVEGGKATASLGWPFSCHNNKAFAKPSLWSLKNYQLIRSAGSFENGAIALQNCGSLKNDELVLEGIGFGGKADEIRYESLWLSKSPGFDYFNHAEWRIKGHAVAPFIFNNITTGGVLRIKSPGTGTGQSVRFNAASSAFPLLIQEPRLKGGDVHISSRKIINGYLAQDGTPGLSAYGFGCKDVAGQPGADDGSNDYTSLAARLGDCSTVSKILGVIINGSTVNIVFDENYAGQTTAYVLGKINAVLGAAGTADIYAYGREYYPMLSDVTEVVSNASTSVPILKGTAVAKSAGQVRPAQEGDALYGIALEDIEATNSTQGALQGLGRILKRGYISTNTADAFYVRNDTAAGETTRYKCVAGVLTADPTGPVRAHRAGIVAINCI